MREHLLGYLLGALEPPEHELVEARLGQDAELCRELKLLEASLVPLASDKEPHEPPPGLAARTCNFVAARAGGPWRDAGLATSGGWRPHDLLVAAGIIMAASMLIFPAVSQSRFDARLRSCQNNLRLIGRALFEYSQLHQSFFPMVPQDGKLAVAGIYAPILREGGYVEGAGCFVCPASPLADEEDAFQVPTLGEIEIATQTRLAALQRTMGGSYGYSFGYVEDGQYQGHRNRARATFALAADAPNDDPVGGSANHGCCGQNVLFEDGHVTFLKTCRLAEGDDHIYANVHGYVGAGIGPDDAVIGRSAAKPILFRTVFGH